MNIANDDDSSAVGGDDTEDDRGAGIDAANTGGGNGIGQLVSAKMYMCVFLYHGGERNDLIVYAFILTGHSSETWKPHGSGLRVHGRDGSTIMENKEINASLQHYWGAIVSKYSCRSCQLAKR